MMPMNHPVFGWFFKVFFCSLKTFEDNLLHVIKSIIVAQGVSISASLLAKIFDVFWSWKFFVLDLKEKPCKEPCG